MLEANQMVQSIGEGGGGVRSPGRPPPCVCATAAPASSRQLQSPR